jgi:hypothetical protein
MDQYIPAFLIAFLASGVVGLINWFIPLRSVTVGFVFGGNVSTLIMLAFAGWFAYHGAWIAAVIAVAGAFGLLSIISPSMHLYTILSRRMHPKYWYAKRGFGITFPFEAYLDR